MKTNIALIGFMGAGKSATGRALAEKTSQRLVETDCLIEQKAGKKIPQIFHENGENAFRELEAQVIEEIYRQTDLIIACGGGVVLNQVNVDRLKSGSWMIWLTASPDVVAKRTGLDSEVRPVLSGIKNKNDIAALMELRKPMYEKAADIVIDTSRLPTKKVAELILMKIKENADTGS